ncbi:MAG: hypothetical protein A2X49_03785 [Lentisphaerae bacterium GWF2_52_8]|nr:MAG: hypothetical protein A2X49_03785 [Lentisphaerae bacterium GWF2_52_8]
MIKIDKEIKTALENASMRYGTVYELSKVIGVSHSTVLFWLNGRTKFISGDVWYEKLHPLLKPYLPSPGISKTPPYWAFSYSSQSQAELSSAKNMSSVPIISFAQAAGFDRILNPIDDFARDCADDFAHFACEIKKGYFALRVEGDSMSPEFCHGTVLLVAGGEYCQAGDISVAKITGNGQVVVKKFMRHGDLFRLESINPTGQSFEWNRENDRNFVEWIYPVVEAKIDLRRNKTAKADEQYMQI